MAQTWDAGGARRASEFQEDYEEQSQGGEDIDYDTPTVLPEDDEEDGKAEEDAVDFDRIGTFEEILEVEDTAPSPYYVKQWKCAVLLKGITKAEFDFMRKKSRNPKVKAMQDEVLHREVILAGVVKPQLTSEKYNILQNKSAGAMIGLFNEILERSGLADEAEKARERRFPRK